MTELFWLSSEQLDRIKPYFPLSQKPRQWEIYASQPDRGVACQVKVFARECPATKPKLRVDCSRVRTEHRSEEFRHRSLSRQRWPRAVCQKYRLRDNRTCLIFKVWARMP
jgi:hypothetical protein